MIHMEVTERVLGEFVVCPLSRLRRQLSQRESQVFYDRWLILGGSLDGVKDEGNAGRWGRCSL